MVRIDKEKLERALRAALKEGAKHTQADRERDAKVLSSNEIVQRYIAGSRKNFEEDGYPLDVLLGTMFHLGMYAGMEYRDLDALSAGDYGGPDYVSAIGKLTENEKAAVERVMLGYAQYGKVKGNVDN